MNRTEQTPLQRIVSLLLVCLLLLCLLSGGCQQTKPDFSDVPTQTSDEILESSPQIGQQRYFFVKGEVRAPNRYAYGGGLTVSKAIASAGDFTEEANRKKVILVRANGGGKFTINLARVDEPDPKVYPGDQIIVPRK